MKVYRVRISSENSIKTYYVRFSDFAEVQELALHTAAQLGEQVYSVSEMSESEFLEEIQQARFIYIE